MPRATPLCCGCCENNWDSPAPNTAAGRPSHALHTYWVGNLRLVLDMQMRSGKQHSSGHAKEGLAKLLDELGTRGPALVRGDCGYGNQDSIEVCEKRDRRYCQTN